MICTYLKRRLRLQNGIPRVYFYFCSAERNYELFSLPRNGLERNSESLLLVLFHGMQFWAFFSSAEWFVTEFREFASIFVPLYIIPSIFLFHGLVRNGIPRVFSSRNSRNSEGTNQLFRLFRLPRIIFLSEIANPNHFERKFEAFAD